MPGILSWLRGIWNAIIGKSSSPVPVSGVPQEAENAANDSPAKDAATQAGVARDSIQKVRDDLAGYGTAIGTVSTALIGTAAVLSLDSLFPLPSSPEFATWWVIGTIAAAVLGPVLLTRRFFGARRRILIDTMEYRRNPETHPSLPVGRRIRAWFARRRSPRRPSGIYVAPKPLGPLHGGLARSERDLVEARFGELAREEGATDVVVLEARAERLGRVSSVATAQGELGIATSTGAESQRLNAVIDTAIAEAALLVIERRSARVYRGVGTIIFALIGAFGIAGVPVVTEWSHGEQERLVSWVECHKDLKDKDYPDVRPEVCDRLDPGPNALPAPSASSAGGSGSGTEPKPSGERSADVNVIRNLRKCMNQDPPSPAPPTELWVQAIAACAGLPGPAASPAASAEKPGG